MNLRQYARTVLALVAVFALLAGGAGVSTAAQGSGSLTVLDWAGFDAEDFWIDFKKANPDVNVTFEIGASDADIFAKMKAGSQADVFHPYTGWLQFYVDEGLVEEIDTSSLTNWDKIPDRFKKLGQFNGKQYFIPYDWGYSSILYRTDLAPDAGESWNAMFDPKYSGHISMWDDGVAAVDVASYAKGWDELKLTDDTARARSSRTGSPSASTTSSTGRASRSWSRLWPPATSGLPMPGRAPTRPCERRMSPSPTPTPRRVATPGSGTTASAREPRTSTMRYAFLDGKMADDTARNVVEQFYYGTANQDVMDSITDPELIEVLAIKDPTVLDRTHFTPNISPEQRDAWAEMWVDVKAS